MLSKKNVLFYLLLLLSAGLSSCSGDDPKPQQATEVEYQVSSTSSLVAREITYTNASGGTTVLNNVTLPFSVKIKPASSSGVSVLIADLAEEDGKPLQLQGRILIDGKEMENKTSEGTKPVISMGYTRP